MGPSVSRAAGNIKVLRMLSPSTQGKPNFKMHGFEGDFSPEVQKDPVAFLGWNLADTGDGNSKENTAYANMFDAWELDYQLPDHSRQMERYIEARSVDGTISIRPIQLYFKTYAAGGSANNTRESFLDTVGFLGPTGGITMSSVKTGGDELTYRFVRGAFTIFGFSDTASAINLQAGTGQASVLDMGYGGTTGVLRLETQTATQALLKVAGNTAFRFFKLNSAFVAVGLNANRNDASLAIHSDPANNGNIILALRRNSGGTANMLSLEESTGASAILSRFDQNGYFMTRKSAAPADADVATGEAAIWFDKTNGAAKLMVKAKQTDGTVVTGSLALA